MENNEDSTTKDFESIITPDKVLFFDLDGTLIDTNLANFLAYKKAIVSVTKSNQDLIYNSKKRFNRSLLKIAVSNLTEREYEQIIREKEKYYHDFLPETKIIAPIMKILQKYSKTNRIVLVTNCRKDRAIATLQYFKLEHKINDIFYRESIDNENKINKYENAISKLGISPSFIIAFEDEESEIEDAKNAGILVINPSNNLK